MIESHLVQRGRRCVGRDVAAVFGIRAVGVHDHGKRVPAYVRLVAPLQRAVAGIIRLLRLGNGIEVGGVWFERQVRAGSPREVHQFFQQKMRALRALRTQDRIDGLQPLLGFDGIDVFERRLLRHRMHTPTCPVKMAGTLQRPCADCHYVVNGLSSGFGFSRSSKGLDRDTFAVLRYADSLALRPTPRAGAPNPRAHYAPRFWRATRAPCCFCRSRPPAADWQALPHAALLRALFERKVRKAGDTFQLRVGAEAQTLLKVACLCRQATYIRTPAGRRQTRAQRARGRSANRAGLAAGLRSAAPPTRPCMPPSPRCKRPRFASRRSRARRNTRAPLARIDLARPGKLADLDLTLATAAGNNLARWLTALPPSTLNAAAYRRLLQQFAQRLRLSFKFYGETQLKRLGAARFSPSRAAMARAMPALRICPIVRAAPQPRP